MNNFKNEYLLDFFQRDIMGVKVEKDYGFAQFIFFK